MYVLGLTTMGEAAAALLWNGELVHAAEEERFSRKKHHVGFPFDAVASCLSSAGITLADVDHIAHYWRPWMLGHRIGHTIPILLKSPLLFQARAKRGAQQLGGHYRRMFQLRSILTEAFGKNSGALHYVEHHLGHAASAYYASPFERSAILTLDGAGESTTTMLSLGEGNRIRVLERIKLPHSLGQFYSAATNFLGFDMFDGDEYKVMGMAAYGEPRFCDFLRENVLRTNGGADFKLDITYLDHHLAKHHVYTEKIQEVFGPPRRPDDEILERHYDIAASVQRALEETVLHLARELARMTGEKRLCLAGGVALNSVMNGRILREGPFEEIFIQPAANDAGGALGSALYVQHHRFNEPRRYRMSNAYLGPGFSPDRCRSAARAAGLEFTESDTSRIPAAGGEGARVRKDPRLVPGTDGVGPESARPPELPRGSEKSEDERDPERPHQAPRAVPPLRAFHPGRSRAALLRIVPFLPLHAGGCARRPRKAGGNPGGRACRRHGPAADRVSGGRAALLGAHP